MTKAQTAGWMDVKQKRDLRVMQRKAEETSCANLH